MWELRYSSKLDSSIKHLTCKSSNMVMSVKTTTNKTQNQASKDVAK